MRVAGLLLAAGAGHRMGSASNKLLLHYRDAPLVCRPAQAVRKSRCDTLYVVVGAQARDLERALADLDAHFIENSDWRSGLASSIRAGVAAIARERPTFDAVLVVLADQPHVTPTHLNALLDAHGRQPDQLVATAYAHTEGVPAIFPRGKFEALMQLEGDTGARALLAAEHTRESSTAGSGQRVAIAFEPAGTDIDTPEDYQALRRHELG